MTTTAKIALWLEYLLVQGVFAGQLVAVVIAGLVGVFFGVDDFWRTNLAVWLIWIGLIVMWVSIGIRDSSRRKPEADR